MRVDGDVLSLMRLLIIVSDFPKVTETFVLSNARHYLARGHDVSLFHLKPFRNGEVVHAEAQEVIDRGVDLPWINGESLRALLWALARPHKFLPVLGGIVSAFWREPSRLAASLAILPKALAMARRAQTSGVDHIHAEFAGYPATSAWVMARMTDIPFSFSAHAHDIFLTQSLLVRKAKDARFVRAISQFNKAFLEALPGVPEGRVEVLRCGVDPGEAAPLPAPPGPGVPLKLLFVGALLPRKGVQHLLAALGQVPTDMAWTLEIIGGGSMEARLKEQANGLPEGCVTFRGPQPAEAVGHAMQAAHAVIVPSIEGDGGRSEGIPVVLMEALSQARPVVTSRLSGIPELVEDGVTGVLTEPGDEAALARAIVALGADYDHAADLGRAGRKRVEEMFDITETAEALLSRMIEESR